ncbi:MAG: hypothetical protein HY940_05600 [Gammaproteobacteria bacterium]|nr:hypothetical protein [Gammaproteobacteria bacterium]
MNPRLLNSAVLALVTTLATPLALADRGDRDDDRAERGYQVEEHYSRHEYRPQRHWRDDDHHRHHRPRGHHREVVQRGDSDYREYRVYRHDDDYDHDRRSGRARVEYDPQYQARSPAPIILGGFIGSVVGNEIGHGNPGHTAVGSIIGTLIGYDIARR